MFAFNNQKQGKIILFMHFHKSGGSTMNEMFNNFNKYPTNRNGNPWSGNQIIPFWNYNKMQFNNFKKHLNQLNVRFIVSEWNFFKYYEQINFHNIELITCIRDPYKRFVSALSNKGRIFNDMHEFEQQNIVWSREKKGCVQQFPININKFNYYVKMLNGFGDNHDTEINDSHLEIAKQNLRKFSTIIILDDPNSFSLLKKYGITKQIQKNQTTHKKNNVHFEEFKKHNLYDYKLYEYAIQLSKKQF